MTKSSRLRDRWAGGENPVVAQESRAHWTSTRRRARAMIAWTCLPPLPRFLR
jgi:hypothetical protein